MIYWSKDIEEIMPTCENHNSVDIKPYPSPDFVMSTIGTDGTPKIGNRWNDSIKEQAKAQ